MDIGSWYKTATGQVVTYKAWNLEKTGLVRHCFTTRLGGVSESPRDTLNLALHVGDALENVLENRARLSRAMGIDCGCITTAEQTHGNSAAVVKQNDAGRGSLAFQDSMQGVDALVTNAVGPMLTLFYADCTPVFIVDPVQRAVGMVHAGWKGTTLNIVGVTLQTMKREFGSQPAGCIAAIGPCIGRCCYEVSNDVARSVLRAVDDERVIASIRKDAWQADLKLANWLQLRREGILEENISVSELCTACNPDLFFSYRRDGETGRMGAMLALK